MSDILHRVNIPDLHMHAYVAVCKDTATDIIEKHNTTPNATVALGRAICATALLSATLKPDSGNTISMKIQGSGPLKEIQVQADDQGNIRGYVTRPRVDEETDLGGINIPNALGAGLMTVTRDLGMKDPYTGTVHLIKGEIAMDTAYYLTSSEQIPSAVVLALNLDKEGNISSAGGILIQTYPDTPESSVAFVEKQLAKPFAALGDKLAEGQDILEYLSQLLGGQKIEIIGSTPLAHRCRCTRERISSMLVTLNPTDLHAMIHEDGGAEVHCTFCNTAYTFSKEELIAMKQEQLTADKN